MDRTNFKQINYVIFGIGSFGLLVFLFGGCCIQIAFNHYGNMKWNITTQFMNIAPNIFSLGFLIDSLRRLRLIAKGVLHIETFQMIWHIWSFVLVVIAGILLSVATNKGEGFDKPKLLYITYECIIIMLWACELPFIYIINKVINQAYVSKKHRE